MFESSHGCHEVYPHENYVGGDDGHFDRCRGDWQHGPPITAPGAAQRIRRDLGDTCIGVRSLLRAFSFEAWGSCARVLELRGRGGVYGAQGFPDSGNSA